MNVSLRHGASVVPAIFTWVLSACATSEPPRSVLVTPPELSPSAAPPASAKTAAPPSAPPDPDEKRTGTPGSTQGTVACGKNRCKAPGETCLQDDKLGW